MTATMFANEVKNDFNNVLDKVASGYEIWILSDENSPIAMISPCLSKSQKRNVTEDLFGFGGVLKGLDVPTDKKELRKAYHERSLA